MNHKHIDDECEDPKWAYKILNVCEVPMIVKLLLKQIIVASEEIAVEQDISFDEARVATENLVMNMLSDTFKHQEKQKRKLENKRQFV